MTGFDVPTRLELLQPALMHPARPELRYVLEDLAAGRFGRDELRLALDPDALEGAPVRAAISAWLAAEEPAGFWRRVLQGGWVPESLVAERGWLWVSDPGEVTADSSMHCAKWHAPIPSARLALALAADCDRIAALDARVREAIGPHHLASHGTSSPPPTHALAVVGPADAQHSGRPLRFALGGRPDRVLQAPWARAAASVRHRVEVAAALDAGLRARFGDAVAALEAWSWSEEFSRAFRAAVARREIPAGPDPAAAYRAVLESGYWFLEAWGNTLFFALPDVVPFAVEHRATAR